MTFIKENFPRLTSSTRLVLLMLVAALIVFVYLGKIDGDTFKDVIMLVIAFFFGQRSGEHQAFSKEDSLDQLIKDVK